MKYKFTTVICIVLLLQLLTVNTHIFAQEKSEEKKPEIPSSTFDEVFYLVQKEFYQNINQDKMLFSSMDSVEEVMEEEGVKTDLTSLPDSKDEDFLLYSYRKNLSLILKKYQNIDENIIMRHAITGMLKSLNDPYTVYFDEEEYKSFDSSLSGGDFCGVGVLIKLDKKNDNLLTVVEPMKNTPAERAGIKVGDIILEIDNISTIGLTLDESAKLLEGPRGTKVSLLIKRKNEANNLTVEIVRDKIHVSSVDAEVIENNIGYIKLSIFGKDTNEDLEEALRELEKENVEGYILDLRNNGGGYVAAAIDVCSKFMPANSVVVYIKSKTDKKSYSSYGSTHKTLPLVILVNEHSASASEITAGALQDTKIATLIGVTTFGKGIVQTIYRLDKDGGAVKITTASYMTPDGRMIDKKGLEPDITVEMEAGKIGTEEDIQLEKAKEYLKTELEN